MSARLRIGLSAVASVAAVLVGATPSLALSERDANAVNQKLIKASFIETFALSGLQGFESRPKPIMCRDIRAAKSDLAAAAKLSREALALIGPDMMGEYKAQRDKLNAMVKIDMDTDTGLVECARAGL